MALFYLTCRCGKNKRVFSTVFDNIPVEKKTCECGEAMVRTPNGPSTHVMEKLDNGAMSRALERYSDAERIFAERHQNADPLAGRKNFS